MDLQKHFEVNYVNPILVALCYPLSNISEFKIIYNAVLCCTYYDTRKTSFKVKESVERDPRMHREKNSHWCYPKCVLLH